MITITFRIDDDEHILTAHVWQLDADGATEHKLTADTVGELRPECAAAIRKHVSETGELSGEVQVG